jgi:hypothetical protein
MTETPAGRREFAFSLPLEWPRETDQRFAYEKALIEYAEMMTPFTRADSESRQELLIALAPFARGLHELWLPSEFPDSIRAFLDSMG